MESLLKTMEKAIKTYTEVVVKQLAEKYGFDVNEAHEVLGESNKDSTDKKRGRPKKENPENGEVKKRGRPKKEKGVVNSTNPGDDLIAALVAEAKHHG